MRVNEFTKKILAHRRTINKWKEEGFEKVDELGGRLWELHRGGRIDCRITEVRIDPYGKELWVKIEPLDSNCKRAPNPELTPLDLSSR